MAHWHDDRDPSSEGARLARVAPASKRTASPSRWRNTFIRLAPSRSPDSSVATMNILRVTLSAALAITRANR